MNFMNSVEEAPMQDSVAEDFSATASQSAQTFTLRQTGGRPVTFSGTHLAMAMNYAPGYPLWYEFNLYRLSDGRFVGDVRCFKTSADEQDMFYVFEAKSFDDLMCQLEAYDASRDIRITFDLEDPELSVADLTFLALSLRIRVEEARRQYRSLLGQVLYDLNQPDV